MANVRPLIFNQLVGAPEVLQAGDTLELISPVQFQGAVGFNGQPPQTAPGVAGDYFTTLDELIKALRGIGLISDQRFASSWHAPMATLQLLAGVGPFEPGRLIIGGVAGWQQLDMPAPVPGVIQVPTAHSGRPELNPSTGLMVQQLAYSPILSYGGAPPTATTALAGALHYDDAGQRLLVFDGTTWQPVLQGVLAAIAGMGATSGTGLIGVQGGSGRLISTGLIGQSLTSTGSDPAWVEWISTASAPPWANGQSAIDPLPTGGGRPANVTSAIWANPARNAESLGFWDEGDRLWKSVYVNNTLLNSLAELRSTATDGDLLSLQGGRVHRIPLAPAGQSLVSTGTGVSWSPRLTRSNTAPTTGADGDLWIDAVTEVTHVREGNRWVPLAAGGSMRGVNASGAELRPGVPVVWGSAGWLLADGRKQSPGSVLGIVQTVSAPGTEVTVATNGVVVATGHQWYQAVDGRDGLVVDSGLAPGVSYYLAGSAAGLLSQTPGPGQVLMGTAIDANHLLLQVGQLQGFPYAQVHQGPVAPPSAKPNELWYDSINQNLQLLLSAGGTNTWTPISGAAAGGGGTGGTGTAGGGTSIVDIEAIDWLPDPKAAAIRFLKSDGSSETIRIRGAGGAVVTMSDDHTLVVDAHGVSATTLSVDGGRFSP